MLRQIVLNLLAGRNTNKNWLPSLRQFSVPVRIFRTKKWLDNYNHFTFYELLRMQKTTFYKFVEAIGRLDEGKILSKKYTGGHVPIAIEGTALIFIWYMATQDTLKRVVGAIDGCHIFVKIEAQHQESYIDRYRRYSINLMAIGDSKNLFTYVFVGYPGSAHDSRVFQNSSLYINIARNGSDTYFGNRHYHLVGDSAFALLPWLMTPYRGNQLTRIQTYHNMCLSQDRIKIEHTFGILKGRWRRIQYTY